MGRRVWCPTCHSVAQVPQSSNASLDLADERDDTQYSVFLCREITRPLCEEPEIPDFLFYLRCPTRTAVLDGTFRHGGSCGGCIVAAGIFSFLIFFLGARA